MYKLDFLKNAETLYKDKKHLASFIIIIILLIIAYSLINKTETFANQNTSPAKYSAGTVDTWIVPDGITEATFTVIGGSGGSRKNEDETSQFYNTSYKKIVPGGYGRKAIFKIPVIKGTKYNIYVGTNGESEVGNAVAHGGKCGDGKIGYNGGDNSCVDGSAGGGGATYISTGDIPENNPLVICAGGSGATGGGINYSSGTGDVIKNGKGNDADDINNIYNTISNGQYNYDCTGNGYQKSGGGGGLLGGNMSFGGKSFIPENLKAIVSHDTTGTPSVTIEFSNPLQDSLKTSYDKVNKSRFNIIDNQDKLNSFSKRINKIKKDLATINSENNTKPEDLTFY